MTAVLQVDVLQETFGERMAQHVLLAKYTSARIGGPADVLLTAKSADELAEMVEKLWALETPFFILGGGSNMLVSDRGVRGVVILNKARKVVFDEAALTVWAESGSNFGALARQAGRKEFSGLEWAAGIPGTVGGAVVGNAGAHGGDTAGSLILAEVLHHEKGRVSWSTEDLAYSYRSSRIKRQPGEAVVLAAAFKLVQAEAASIKEKMDQFLAFRRRSQPPGASMGSMFKNPPGDYAGRLIDAAGLKGTRVGEASISELHGNFFINHGGATATQVYALIRQAQETVKQQFGIELELEIEIVGDWKQENE